MTLVSVMNVSLYDKSIQTAISSSISEASQPCNIPNRLISATSAHGLIVSRRDRNFADLLKSFYWILPDGVPLVWIGRLKGAKEMGRCYGPQFFEDVIRRSGSTSINHFFCGGKEGVARELKQVCEQRFGNRNCVGTFSPPFREMSADEFRLLGDMINSTGADIVWIGLSTPKQEIFATKLSEFVSVKFIITVGAAFDFHTGRVKEAPKFMQRNGLEWVFRLMMEPKRLFKRYFVTVPAFLFYGTLDVLGYYYQKIIGEEYVS